MRRLAAQPGFGRRTALLGAGAAIASSAISTSAVHASASLVAPPSATLPPIPPAAPPITPATRPDALAAHGLTRAAVSGVARGSELAGFVVRDVFAARHGGVPVIVRTPRGDDVTLELLRSGAGAAPVARAGDIAIYVANRGRGSKATDADAERAARALAALLGPTPIVPAGLVDRATRDAHAGVILSVPRA